MGLDALVEDVTEHYGTLDDGLEIALDRETRNELAMLEAALDPEETGEVVRRAIHMFFQSTVERGTLDFHLRNGYDVTYDEYLSGMTYDEMTGTEQIPGIGENEDRRYQF